jgi:hypothetical protein
MVFVQEMPVYNLVHLMFLHVSLPHLSIFVIHLTQLGVFVKGKGDQKNRCEKTSPNPVAYVVFRFLFVFLSPLVWFFLWLPEEVLALLFHHENGDFSFLMRNIYSVVDGYPGFVE